MVDGANQVFKTISKPASMMKPTLDFFLYSAPGISQKGDADQESEWGALWERMELPKLASNLCSSVKCMLNSN